MAELRTRGLRHSSRPRAVSVAASMMPSSAWQTCMSTGVFLDDATDTEHRDRASAAAACSSVLHIFLFDVRHQTR